MTALSLALAVGIAVASVGCLASLAAPPTTAPAKGDDRFTVTLASATRVTFTAKVPTGGWRLTTDRVVLEGTAAQVFATLDPPDEGEMVTQAFATLTGEGKTAKAAESAELYVRTNRTRGGDQTDAEYAKVATTAPK